MVLAQITYRFIGFPEEIVVFELIYWFSCQPQEMLTLTWTICCAQVLTGRRLLKIRAADRPTPIRLDRCSCDEVLPTTSDAHINFTICCDKVLGLSYQLLALMSLFSILNRVASMSVGILGGWDAPYGDVTEALMNPKP